VSEQFTIFSRCKVVEWRLLRCRRMHKDEGCRLQACQANPAYMLMLLRNQIVWHQTQEAMPCATGHSTCQ